MANPQHLEWLLEGVEAWNARREREDFVADLRGADLREANLEMVDLRGADLAGADLSEAKLMRSDLSAADLRGAVLRRADLEAATLSGADLSGTDLRGANVEGADLRRGTILRRAKLASASLAGAHCSGADFRGADFRGADMEEGDFRRADVRSVCLSASASISDRFEFTDFSSAISLQQRQLDSMDGDTGVILPPHLHHPAHWPDPESPKDTVNLETTEAVLELTGADLTITQEDPTSSFRSRISFILEHPQLALASAAYSANQIDAAVAAYRKAEGSPNQLPPEMEAFMLVSTSFREIERLIRANKDLADTIVEKDKLVADLDARVDVLGKRIEDLAKQLAVAPKDSLAKQYITPTLTGAGGNLLAAFLLFTGGVLATHATPLAEWAFSQPNPAVKEAPELEPMPRPDPRPMPRPDK